MKKQNKWLLGFLTMFLLMAWSTALAEGEPSAAVHQPLTWEHLATIAGAAAFTLMVVQFTKAPLDRVWKIPTRLYAYMITLTVMLVATAFTTGITLKSALLVVCNALVAALTAYGAYEVTFAKREGALADTGM